MGQTLKNKRLLIILIIFGFLTLLVVLGSAVFRVSSVTVSWRTDKSYFESITDQEIVDAGEFNLGESVFFVDKQVYINNLEKAYPYLEVRSIETVFPNKLVLHVAEREAVYALEVTDSENSSNTSYVLLDWKLKVLEKTTQTIVPSTDENTPILLQTNLAYTDLDFEVGTTASQVQINQILTNFYEAMQQLSYTASATKGFAKSIEINYSTRCTFYITTGWGVIIQLEDATTKTFEKMQKAISTYLYLHDENPILVSTGTLLVYENIQDNIIEVELNN